MRWLRTLISRVLCIKKSSAFNTMEITKENFSKKLPEVLSNIKAADFISFDLEFTGLNKNGSENVFDTLEERYAYVKNGALEFYPVQFGLCTFVIKNNKIMYTPYSFYLFPQNHYMTPNFLMQTSSIQFLIHHGFDFNKAFDKGIGSLRLSNLEEARAALQERHQRQIAELEETEQQNGSGGTSVLMHLKAEDELLLNDICEKVKNYLQLNANIEQSTEVSHTSANADDQPENAEHQQPDQPAPLLIPNLNGYQRKIVYTYLLKRLDVQMAAQIKIATVYDKANEKALLSVSKLMTEGPPLSALEQLQEKHRKGMEQFEESVGFSRVIEALTCSNAYLIGHCCFLDLCHTIERFLAPLPDTFEEFKMMVHSFFPRILDTKLISYGEPFSEFSGGKNNLSIMHKWLSQQPFVSPEFVSSLPEGVDDPYAGEDDLYHDGGYDAFITGKSLAIMCHYLAIISADCRVGAVKFTRKSFEYHVAAHLNHIFAPMCVGYKFINLAGEDALPERDGWYRGTVPQNWRNYNLLNMLKPVLGAEGTVSNRIIWFNETTVWFKLGDAENPVSSNAVLALSNEKAGFKVESYDKTRKRASALPFDDTDVTNNDYPSKKKIKCVDDKRDNKNGVTVHSSS